MITPGNNFFDMFTFDVVGSLSPNTPSEENDPTNDYVNYLDASDAQAANLAGVVDGVVTIRSDSSNIASGRGRESVRVTSRNQYTHGLVNLDLAHMPGKKIHQSFSSHATGEIDIIEGVNHQATNATTLHTSANCTMMSADCSGVEAGGPPSFGDGLNANGGCVDAMQWTSEQINVWFFPPGAVSADALSDGPDPAGWGSPTAQWVGGDGCDMDEHFGENVVVFDTTFCGERAAGVWPHMTQCALPAPSSQDYIRNHPEAYADTYWSIDPLKVYTDAAAVAGKRASAVH
ncbi:hypothetical protein HO133_004236 [Letharia lupina]|uniref:GH16 domain-containing protein n=1 Tax=Letharia lupina TaxID=560253 RepID=A0A8H6FJV1_9LECA|nr:uncharacterized protein HO133_004236 [Letharia lupina]KAF6229899.1 hypothetical protein HO133_004236 [Letharia lupina]